jgi:hypothetical protein
MPEGIIGWARRPDEPERTSRVFLLANDVVIGSGIADRFDIEAVRASLGPGVPGFLIQPNFLPNGPFPVALTVREADGTPIGEPLLVRRPEQFGALPRVSSDRSSQYEGMVEGLREGQLIGWIRNRIDPANAVVVELFDGVESLGRQAADIFRGDLAEADKRGGHCAFCFELPATLLDGTAHLLHVRIAGTAVELTSSPIGFGPLAISDLIHEISSLRAEVKRLSKAVDFAVAPNGAFQSGLLRELCDRVTAYSEIQREAIESELDALRAMTFAPRLVAPKPAKQAPPARSLRKSR